MNPAFAYLYDEFLNDKRYERELNDIEAQLANRHIGGRIARLAMFRSAKALVEDVVHQGAKNIVIVGNDASLGRFMWHTPGFDAAVGFLPVGKPSRFAEVLGIPPGAKSVEVLAARFIERFDIGRADEESFLTEIVVTDPSAEFLIDGFSIKPADGGSILIRNLGLPSQSGEPDSDGKDGRLEVIIRPKALEGKKSRWKRQEPVQPEEQTVLSFEEGELVAPHPIEIEVDGHIRTGERFRISVDRKHLQMITGRGRRTV